MMGQRSDLMPIKIVSESKRETVVRARPERASVHPWCPEESGAEPLIYVTSEAADAMFAHCLSEKEAANEVMGLLIGELFDDEEGVQYGMVRETATSRLEADSISVRFADFSQLMQELDQLDYDWILLGWYHSHPGHTCFLSATDIDTHSTMFKHDHQVAIVIDPINVEAKSFIIRDSEVLDIPLLVLGTPAKLEGRPLHLRSDTRQATRHGGAEPVSVATSTIPTEDFASLTHSELLLSAVGAGIAVAPLAYQLVTNEWQPHWFNPPTVMLGLVGYLLILIGLKRNLNPLLERIGEVTESGTLLVLYGMTSAAGLLLLGAWRLANGEWADHFMWFAVLMGFVALVGKNQLNRVADELLTE
jgi:proteasome lid subunit RPN8/RPN11